ncbi:MAG: ribosome-associated translation inhibitor RaiA [Phycisphaerales bacterium]|mgnify:FL=1|nr:ribosome-associated translation inhibitor RaiA [Phycisphaerales bacterium]
MRIDVVGRGVEVTDAIRTHAETKCAKLPRYFDGTQSVTLTLSRENHHRHAEFDAELVIDVEKHDNFVAHARDEDLYAAIDLVIDKAARQLTDFKERLKMGKR